MKTYLASSILILLLSLWQFDEARSFSVLVNDTAKTNFLQGNFELEVKKGEEGIIAIRNGTWNQIGSTGDNSSATYIGFVTNTESSAIEGNLGLDILTNSAGETINVQEFTFKFDLRNGSLIGNNVSGALPMELVVNTPKFTHFQVKRGWRFKCESNSKKEKLAVQLCPKAVNSTQCDEHFVLHQDVKFWMRLSHIEFADAFNLTDDNQVEECPVSYETKTDIGIGCIVAFWTIVLGVTTVFVVKAIMKKNRNS